MQKAVANGGNYQWRLAAENIKLSEAESSASAWQWHESLAVSMRSSLKAQSMYLCQ